VFFAHVYARAGGGGGGVYDAHVALAYEGGAGNDVTE